MFRCDLILFDQDIDELEVIDKTSMAKLILGTISEMRQYLLSNSQLNLSSFKPLSSAALGILHWVVSSNLTYITLIDKPYKNKIDFPPFANAGEIDTNSEVSRYHIKGMNSWAQF